MASSGKKKTTMAKLSRESRLRERRIEKKARKDARRRAAADPSSQLGDTLIDADGFRIGQPLVDGEPVADGEFLAEGDNPTETAAPALADTPADDETPVAGDAPSEAAPVRPRGRDTPAVTNR